MPNKTLLFLLALAVFALAQEASLYNLTVKSLDGQPAPLAQYRGKVCLVVNVASGCGYTPQYKGLQALYEKWASQGFLVLGFPSNDFGQETGSPEEIRSFCTSEFHVTFPMFEKVSVKGPDQSPVYAFLSAGAGGKTPNWNFGKYLVNKQGHVVKFYGTQVKPADDELDQAIKAALAAKS